MQKAIVKKEVHPSIHQFTISQVHMHPSVTVHMMYMSGMRLCASSLANRQDHEGSRAPRQHENFDSRHSCTTQAHTRHEIQEMKLKRTQDPIMHEVTRCMMKCDRKCRSHQTQE